MHIRTNNREEMLTAVSAVSQPSSAQKVTNRLLDFATDLSFQNILDDGETIMIFVHVYGDIVHHDMSGPAALRAISSNASKGSYLAELTQEAGAIYMTSLQPFGPGDRMDRQVKLATLNVTL